GRVVLAGQELAGAADWVAGRGGAGPRLAIGTECSSLIFRVKVRQEPSSVSLGFHIIPAPSFASQAVFRRHQPRRPPIWISSGRATRSRMPWRFRHMDRLQMPNTINATNPMPTNSTTSATESYSSQCRLPESMTFHPCFKWTARIGRQLPPALRRSSAAVATSRKATTSKDQAGQASAGDGTASSEASQRKPSFDPRIAGLEAILHALGCAFPKWILQASLWPRDRRFRRRPASSRVQPKTYRHRGEPGGNAYDRAS